MWLTAIVMVGCGGGDTGGGSSQDAGNPYIQYQLDAGGQWQCDTGCPEQSEQRTASIICQRSRREVCSNWLNCRRRYCRLIRSTNDGERYDYLKDCVESIERPHDLEAMEQKCIDEAKGDDVTTQCESVTAGDHCQAAQYYKTR
jgi:hypothetical protein